MGSCLHCAVVDDMMDITHPAETAKEMHNDKRSDVQQCCFTGQSVHGERSSSIVSSFWGLHDECREVLTMPPQGGCLLRVTLNPGTLQLVVGHVITGASVGHLGVHCLCLF